MNCTTMPIAEVYNPTTPSDLYRLLDKFIHDNEHSRDVECRWLADQAIGLKMMAHALGINGISSFQIKHKKELAAFRLLEIEEERAKLNKADAKLADEARKLGA